METTLNNSIIWEEKNLTEPAMKYENNGTFVQNDIIRETKNELKKKECNDIGEEKKWKRNCPKCNKEFIYKNKYILRKAIKLDKLCKECTIPIRSEKQHSKENCVGKKFHRLTISKQFIGKNNKTIVECICECGNSKNVSLSRLRFGRVKSCGCYRKEKVSQNNVYFKRKDYGESSFNALYNGYINNAKQRRLDFLLSKNEAKILFISNCFYCGCKPNQIVKLKNGYGEFIYNGIDRKDNTRGYTLENSVSCCSFCNFTKNDTPFNDFIQWIRIVNETTKNINL